MKININERHTMSLQNTQYLASSNTLHLSNPMRITENNTNLRGRQALLGKLADVLLNLKNKNQPRKYNKQ